MGTLADEIEEHNQRQMVDLVDPRKPNDLDELFDDEEEEDDDESETEDDASVDSDFDEADPPMESRA